MTPLKDQVSIDKMDIPTETLEELRWQTDVWERRVADYEALLENARRQLKSVKCKLVIAEELHRRGKTTEVSAYGRTSGSAK